MPFQIIRQDITLMAVDAIVNTADPLLKPGGGVSGAIHKASGPQLAKACAAIGSCPIGQARITPGFQLPSRYVIHTAGPVWNGGFRGEKEMLRSCYRRCLETALQYGCRSIAFPLIASGLYGFPKKLALSVASDAITEFLLLVPQAEEMTVYLVMFTKESLAEGSKLFNDIRQYIDDAYVADHWDARREQLRPFPTKASLPHNLPIQHCPPEKLVCKSQFSLEDALRQLDESFSQMLLRKIQEKGIKNADCYKKANIDKKLFSKIINSVHYKPKKTTALALAVALELPLSETKELLSKAGFALTHSDKLDIIVEYFILHKNFDIFQINEILYDFDQPLLGGAMQ